MTKIGFRAGEENDHNCNYEATSQPPPAVMSCEKGTWTWHVGYQKGILGLSEAYLLTDICTALQSSWRGFEVASKLQVRLTR